MNLPFYLDGREGDINIFGLSWEYAKKIKYDDDEEEEETEGKLNMKMDMDMKMKMKR